LLDLTIEKEIKISASTKNVWEVLTNPVHIKKYLFGSDAKSDWQKGSPIVFSGEYQGQKYEDHGNILDIEKEKLLRYDYWSSFSGVDDVPENYSTITFQLEGPDMEITLHLTQKGFVSRDGYEHSQQNWEMVLGEIKKIAQSL